MCMYDGIMHEGIFPKIALFIQIMGYTLVFRILRSVSTNCSGLGLKEPHSIFAAVEY
jgi:hypothetical protein